MLNRPGFPGERLVHVSGGSIADNHVSKEGPLCFSWGDLSDGAVQARIGVPVDPFQGFPSGPRHGFPRFGEVDDLSLEPTDGAFGEGVVVAVADAANEVSMSASARRSVYLIDRCWAPQTK